MALRKKKRYKAPSIRMHATDGRVWKVVLCIALGMGISLAVFFTGLHLNKELPEKGSSDAQTTAPETEDAKPTFQFKDVRKTVTADKKALTLLPADQTSVDTVTVSVSDKDGKLRYRSAALNVLAGAETQKNLPTLEALVSGESVDGKRISLLYKPFSLEENTSLALNCIRLVIGEMCSFGVDEIVIDARDLGSTQIGVIATVLPNRENVQIGLLLSGDVLEEKNSETLVRAYYLAYDFLAFDLSVYPLDAPETTAETGESAETETLELFLKRNQLIIAKYSARIHTVAKSVQDIEKILSLADTYEACGVSLYAE